MSTEAWLALKANTANHTLDVLHDDGLCRHLRMSTDDSFIWSWEIITWPGSLAIRGDIGRELVFTRVPDMFDFFRDPNYHDTVADGGAPRINPDYWAEKTRTKDLKVFELEPAMIEVAEHMVGTLMRDYPRRGDTVRDPDEWTEDLATCCALIEAWEDFRDACNIGDTDEEQAIVSWLMGNPDVGDHDAWEWDLRVWDFHYLVACYAIVATVAAWDRRGPANYSRETAHPEYGVGFHHEGTGITHGVISYDTAADAAGVLEENRQASYEDVVATTRRVSSWRPISDDELARAAADENKES